MTFKISIPGDSELLHDGYMYITNPDVNHDCSTITKVNLTDLTITPWLNADIINDITLIPQGFSGMVIYNNYMYVVNIFEGTITKIELSNPQNIIIWHTGLTYPFDIKVYNGFFYVTQNDKVTKINAANKNVAQEWIYPQPVIGYFMFINNNNLYIPACNPGIIYKIDLLNPANELIVFLDDFGDINPQSIYITNDVLYAVAMYGNGIYRINIQTKSSTLWKSLICGQVVCDNEYMYFIGDGSFSRVNLVSSTIPDSFFINEVFTISHTSNMHGYDLPTSIVDEYDYILNININGYWTSMNNLFSERRFMTEGDPGINSGNYDSVHLNINRESLADLLEHANTVDIKSYKSSIYTDYKDVYDTLAPEKQLVGFRFLEIVASKIFGHAKIKIAIENSEEYYANDYNQNYNTSNTLIGQIARGIFNSVTNKKNDIMNDYIKTDRIQDNADYAELSNINGYPHQFMSFSFNDTIWEFPIVFHTELSSTSGDIISLLNNGPNIGGSQLVNGVVNVPILLRFHE
jgi:hypothetical protein